MLFNSVTSATEGVIENSGKSVVDPSQVTLTSQSISLTQGVQKVVLDNGLTVLIKEVHTAPVAAVQVWYKVGSRDESPGVNGITHQLEHMLFQGTKNRPIQYGRLLAALGGDFNAFTSYDQTAYHNTVEVDQLESVLILEADRMQNTLINAEQLEKEKQVVISELQGYANNPYYRLNRAVMKAAFPNHPYGLMVGGSKADVESFTLEQVQAYYDRDYNPRNSVLVILGDFQAKSVLQKVQDIFGQIPQKNAAQTSREQRKISHGITNTFPPTSPASSQPIVLQEPGNISIMQALYPLPDANHPDVPAMDVMDYLLSNGRSSRLYQAMVESGLASEIGGTVTNLSSGGWYELYAVSPSKSNLSVLQDVLQEQVTRLQTQQITTLELQRAKTQIQADLVIENRDITSQALTLGDAETVTGDYQSIDRYLDAIAKVTAADIQRVAQIYLRSDYQTTGFFMPTEIGETDETPSQSLKQTQNHFRLSIPADPSEVEQYLPPAKTQFSRQERARPEKLILPNGMKVLLLVDHNTSTVSLTGYIQAGEAFDPKSKAGLANLVEENLLNGTASQDALALAQTLENQGASLEFKADSEGLNFSGVSLSPDSFILIKTLADVLQNATFPEHYLELTRQQNLTDLRAAESDAGYVAYRALRQSLYPKNHPFHEFPSEQSLQAIHRRDLINFYRDYYRPESTTLVLVGDFDPTVIHSQIKALFDNWQAKGTYPQKQWPEISFPSSPVYVNAELPGIQESIIMMGHPSIVRRDPRFYAALVLNEVLGGNTLSSRLGTELRDRLGLTYGVFSSFNAGLQSGSFTVDLQTAPETEQQAIATTLALLEQIRSQGVTAAEINIAKRGIISSNQIQLTHPDVLAEVILWHELNQLTQNELVEFVTKIEAVTLEEVNAAAQTLIHPDKIVVVTARGK
ncbi:MAG: M16 family metallopeptidase [Microcoleaceae cyanobacterium]